MTKRDEQESTRRDFIDPNYAMAMREKGFGWNTLAAIRKTRCPNCGFEFSLTYARTIACRGCPMATRNCPKVRCAKCDHEYYISEISHVGKNEFVERSVVTHQSRIERQYNEQIGRTRHR